MKARENELKEQGKFAETEALIHEILEILVKRGDEGRLDLAGYQGRLAETLVMLGKFEEAESLARTSLAIRERAGLEQQVPWSSATLGSALVGQKRYVEAEPLLVPACETLRRLLGNRRPSGGGLRTRIPFLVQLYEATGRPEQAAEWRKFLATIPDPAPPPPAR